MYLFTKRVFDLINMSERARSYAVVLVFFVFARLTFLGLARS